MNARMQNLLERRNRITRLVSIEQARISKVSEDLSELDNTLWNLIYMSLDKPQDSARNIESLEILLESLDGETSGELSMLIEHTLKQIKNL